MARLTDKLVASWHMQAKPLIEKEQNLMNQLAGHGRSADDGLSSIFFDSHSSLKSRLYSVRAKQLELATVFTLKVIQQAAGTDGKMNKLYREYKDRREAEVPGWPMVYSTMEQNKDYLLRYFLLQRIEIDADQQIVLDQMFEFYKNDDKLPAPYFPEKDPDSWYNNLDLD